MGEVSHQSFIKKRGDAEHLLEAVHNMAISFPTFELAEEPAVFERGPNGQATAPPTNAKASHPDGN